MGIILGVLVLVVIGLGLILIESHTENKKLKDDLKFTKETVAALYSKPIYAAITDTQIERLGQIIASYVTPKEWLN